MDFENNEINSNFELQFKFAKSNRNKHFTKLLYPIVKASIHQLERYSEDLERMESR